MKKFELIKEIMPQFENMEPPEGLKVTERKYVLNLIQGYGSQQAYRLALGGRAAGKTPMQLSKGANKFKSKPLVQQYHKAIMQEMERVAVANSLEIQIFLSAAIFTGAGQIDKDSPLCQEYAETITIEPNGRETINRKVKVPSKHACAQLLARIQGIEKPIQVAHTHKGGVMVVPMASSLEEWEQLAVRAQKQLMQDALIID